MATITHRAGSAERLVFAPMDETGELADLTGLSMQLRIGAGAECVVLDGEAGPEGFNIDLTALDLPPRLYRASEYYHDGHGWRWIADHNLHIIGGC